MREWYIAVYGCEPDVTTLRSPEMFSKCSGEFDINDVGDLCPNIIYKNMTI